MANSRQFHFHPGPFKWPSRTPGPLGHNDAATPNTTKALAGDTPGPLGINDHGTPASRFRDKGEPELNRSPGTRYAPRTMSISQAGLRFIWKEEYVKGISERLHWPRGASGVTLGAGYDMKCRSSNSIKKDLMSVGISEEQAKKVAKAAGLCGEAAKKFISEKENLDLIQLDESMALSLLKLTVKDYEGIVKTLVKVPLRQNEYDALVSFAYNPGGRFRSVANLINNGKVLDAVIKISGATTSGGKVLMGLVYRRSHEIDLYLNGNYR